MGKGVIFKSAEIGVHCEEQQPHTHAASELFVALGGRTTDVINGQESRTLPLDVFVLTEDVRHGRINSEDYRYCIFKFDMNTLVARLGEAAEGEGFQSIFIVEPSMKSKGLGNANMQIDPLFAEYAELTARILENEGESELSDEIFTSLVLLISERATRRDDKSSGVRRAVGEAVLYINTRYQENISLDSLAERSGYSPRHLSRAFKELTGSSPIRYLENVRLTHAAALLSEGRLSVTEVAMSVGIEDSSMFAKCFRKKFGVSPTEYRRSSVSEQRP